MLKFESADAALAYAAEIEAQASGKEGTLSKFDGVSSNRLRGAARAWFAYALAVEHLTRLGLTIHYPWREYGAALAIAKDFEYDLAKEGY